MDLEMIAEVIGRPFSYPIQKLSWGGKNWRIAKNDMAPLRAPPNFFQFGGGGGLEEEGKNVVHKRLQTRGEDPATEQSQAYTEEIASESLEHTGIIGNKCGKCFRTHTIINCHLG